MELHPELLDMLTLNGAARALQWAAAVDEGSSGGSKLMSGGQGRAGVAQ